MRYVPVVVRKSDRNHFEELGVSRLGNKKIEGGSGKQKRRLMQPFIRPRKMLCWRARILRREFCLPEAVRGRLRGNSGQALPGRCAWFAHQRIQKNYIEPKGVNRALCQKYDNLGR